MTARVNLNMERLFLNMSFEKWTDVSLLSVGPPRVNVLVVAWPGFSSRISSAIQG